MSSELFNIVLACIEMMGGKVVVSNIAESVQHYVLGGDCCELVLYIFWLKQKNTF